MMGCSNPHPHGQIWANETLPNKLVKELAALGDYRQLHGTTLRRSGTSPLKPRRSGCVMCQPGTIGISSHTGPRLSDHGLIISGENWSSDGDNDRCRQNGISPQDRHRLVVPITGSPARFDRAIPAYPQALGLPAAHRARSALTARSPYFRPDLNPRR